MFPRSLCACPCFFSPARLLPAHLQLFRGTTDVTVLFAKFCGWCYLLMVFMGFLAVHALVYKSVYTLTAVAFLACNFLWW